jgi:hypothetical protein
LLPTAEETAPWGTGCIFDNDPKFIRPSPSSASHLRFFKDSPAREKGTTTNAPPKDISGNPRDPHPDIGSWEWIDTNVAPVGINLSNSSIARTTQLEFWLEHSAP